MKTTVGIYHGAFEGEDVNKRVFRYRDEIGIKDSYILHRAFKMFNAPPEALEDDELEIMEKYRKEELRSLSVGDVVEIENVKYLCESAGWKKLKNISDKNAKRKNT